ncbi:Wzz/FepE/Etk N-terminal domain-containing protein [Flavicella marina]|uniref:Wzz/FepE/Etk N-terminal domain-containing protein n=1 Tax=Flavicella marina TaxID=1475951 RepID=UPI001264C570|nr:Wzz/FepE/Etk N-terminal domain-containing protein [Flavicella marina]
MSQDVKNTIREQDEIDLMSLVKTIWSGRKTIIKTTLIFMLLGLFIAIFSEKEYTASTTFVTQDAESKIGGSIGGLAAMAGINLGGMGSNSEISPIHYPKIMENIGFQLDVLKAPLSFVEEKNDVSFENYYQHIYKPSLLGVIYKYTIGLPRLLISYLKGGKEKVEDLNKLTIDELIEVSEEQNLLLKRLSKQLLLQVNENDGYITIEANMPQAKPAAQLVKHAQELLQNFIIESKIKKATEQLDYIKERYEIVEQKFIEVQLKLAKFEDKNKYVNTAMSKIELQTIQDEYNLVYSVYTELAKQLEAQYLQITKDTPVFTILKPVTVPVERSKPKRGLILVSWVLLGVIVGVILVITERIIKKNIKE